MLVLLGFAAVMEIDSIGTFTMSRSALPALRVSGDAAIVNISATLHYGATWYQVHASAAKVRCWVPYSGFFICMWLCHWDEPVFWDLLY